MPFDEVTIGNCRLIHGDCREVLPLLPPVDLVLTDPPYGIYACGGKWGKKADLQWDKEAADNEDQLLAAGTVQIIWGGNYLVLPPSRGWLAWRKPDRAPSAADFELAWTSMDMNARLIDQTIAATNAERVGHPTQKPLRVMEWSLSFCPEAQTVCDPYMGSGTTGVACARMGLQFVGIERERKYFDIAVRRIEQAYAQPRLFGDAKVGAGETAVQGDMLLPANSLAAMIDAEAEQARERCVMACDKWISLDDAARANLRGADLSEFFRYRDRLRDEGHQWTGDAEEILTGFIWDNSEE